MAMAEDVESKNNQQCRSHHMKMLKTHKNLESIIAFFLSEAKSTENISHPKPRKLKLQEDKKELEMEENFKIDLGLKPHTHQIDLRMITSEDE